LTWGKRKDGQAYNKDKKGMSGSKMETSPTSDVHMKNITRLSQADKAKAVSKIGGQYPAKWYELADKMEKDVAKHQEENKEDNKFSVLSGNDIHLKEHDINNEEFGRGYWSGLNDEQKLEVVKKALKYVPKEERHDMEHIESKLSSTNWDDLYEDEKESILKVIC
jgi:hypothetical protein